MTTPAAPILRRLDASEVGRTDRVALDRAALRCAEEAIEGVRERGARAIAEYASRFGERAPGEPLVLDQAEMRRVTDSVDPADLSVLERTAARIGAFARAQRQAIGEVSIPIPGGEAGHTVEPVEAAGCYAPCGRYPLPSSALMTAVTAREAGCNRVVVASPGAHPLVVAAASIAGADAFLAVGGAHAIAALSYGFEGFDPVDVIAGPGNRWVTAAKHLVSGEVGIDMLAGPSELLVLADASADAAIIAADLLAQAEHDDDAVPMLVTTSTVVADAVEGRLVAQLRDLPTRATATRALGNGFACVVETLDNAIDLANRIAPEHLELLVKNPSRVAARVRHAGAVFLGPRSAEVFGDYGAGPNHTLPTGGTARFQGGLSVVHFLRLRTWLRLDGQSVGQLGDDTEHLARLEGLAGHARAAAARR